MTMSLLALAKRLLPAILSAAVLAAGPSGTALAQDGQLGPLTALTEGFLDPWQLELRQDGYFMQNATDDTSIRFVWARSPEVTLGTRTLTAWVDITLSDPTSNAGLLYGFVEEDDGTTFYYMFMVQPDNRVTLYRRDVDGVATITTTQSDAIRSGINDLAITEAGDQITLSVNDEVVAILGGVRGMGAGHVGIVAWGIGEFLFSGFSDESPIEVPDEVPGKGPPAEPPAAKG